MSVESGIAATIIARRGGYFDFQPDALDYDYTFTPTFARMDADRYPDILSVADFSNSRVFMSNGENAGLVTFRDTTDNSTCRSTATAWARPSATWTTTAISTGS